MNGPYSEMTASVVAPDELVAEVVAAVWGAKPWPATAEAEWMRRGLARNAIAYAQANRDDAAVVSYPTVARQAAGVLRQFVVTAGVALATEDDDADGDQTAGRRDGNRLRRIAAVFQWYDLDDEHAVDGSDPRVRLDAFDAAIEITETFGNMLVEDMAGNPAQAASTDIEVDEATEALTTLRQAHVAHHNLEPSCDD